MYVYVYIHTERESTNTPPIQMNDIVKNNFFNLCICKETDFVVPAQIAPFQSVDAAFLTITVILTRGFSVVIISSIVILNFQYSFESSQFIFQSKRFAN